MNINILAEIYEPGAENRTIDRSDYTTRPSVRAVVTDSLGRVVLLHAGRDEYHKLPGGGVEPQEGTTEEESDIDALSREVDEELGRTVDRKTAIFIGRTIEHRDKWHVTQTSDCYVVTVTDEQHEPRFTDEEVRDQMEVKWVNDMEEALQLVQADRPTSYIGRFVQERDAIILRYAMTLPNAQTNTQE